MSIYNDFDTVGKANSKKICYGLVKYCILLDIIENGNTKCDEFKKLYSGFFGLNIAMNSNDKEKYYKLFNDNLEKHNNFNANLDRFKKETGKFHISFISKLMHMTQGQNFPIYDSVVGYKHFGVKFSSDNKDEYSKYVQEFGDVLNKISKPLNEWFNVFVENQKPVIEKYYNDIKTVNWYTRDGFNLMESIKNISDVKKLDFILWVDKACKINIESYLKTLD